MGSWAGSSGGGGSEGSNLGRDAVFIDHSERQVRHPAPGVDRFEPEYQAAGQQASQDLIQKMRITLAMIGLLVGIGILARLARIQQVQIAQPAADGAAGGLAALALQLDDGLAPGRG